MKIAIAVILLLAGVVGLWFFWRWRRGRSPRIISFVALLREPLSLDPVVLARIAGKVWQADLGDGTSEGKDGFVVARDQIATIMHAGQMYLINSIPLPYVEDPAEAAESIGDLRIRELFREHRAWFSCDSLGITWMTPAGEVAERYRDLAKLFAEFLNENCLLIYSPDSSRAWPINEETQQALKADDPIAALQESLTVPVISVSDDDPLMQEAVAKARTTWPEFLAAFEAGAGEDFSIKAPVTAGGNTEFIWIGVTSTEGAQIFGKLANDPANLGSLKLGSKVAVKLADLNDWCYIDRQGNLQGGFTIAAVQKASRRR